MPVQFKERAISVIVNNRPDVLARIAGTFSARGFNIESISANITRNPAVTKIIITTLTTPETIAQVIKQLNRLVDVLEARRLRRPQAVRREMILARVPLTGQRRSAVRELVETRGGKVVNEESGSAVLEFTGDKEELEEILTCLEALDMEDFSRTGVIAL
ncbi:MAG: acetolactate synthase small subunit, partial [Syntrophales bacterium]|nr:acetolactate synthase small subunit [Syntrophales bacterium]